MNAKKLITVLVVALVLFFLISQPMQSAATVHNILNWLRQAAEALITFVKNLFS
jgi:ribose/xylose/arabinose/galactoside ABC-type transport system permease subunit